MTHTFGGALTSAGLIGNRLAEGVAVLSMDKNYLAKRERDERERLQAAARGRETHNVKTGIKSAGRGLLSGMKGLVSKPITGARSGGVVGLIKGFALMDYIYYDEL